MKRLILAITLVAAAAFVVPAPEASGQLISGRRSQNLHAMNNGSGLLNGRIGGAWRFSNGGTYNEDGAIIPDPYAGRAPNARQALRYSQADHFSPNPEYAYSRSGIEAGLTNEWNHSMMVTNPWHDNYDYWRFGGPTALVVPPTAAFQSHYAWGVGQTKSNPIYHQYGMGGYGGGSFGGGGTNPAPYWPNNTDQYGVYPVRAPH